MARALGIGGVFFKSPDPGRLCDWYQRWLGLRIGAYPGTEFHARDLPVGAYTVWSAFPADTEYFGPADQSFMVNLIVDDLDAALAQVAEGGAQVVKEPEESELGRFGWFVDPDGHRVELWQMAP